jgi:NitT/TauT family transport system permease protein/sulfonate transport system permease protein
MTLVNRATARALPSPPVVVRWLNPRRLSQLGAFTVPLALALLAWEAISRVIDKPSLLPAPSHVIRAGAELAESGQLFRDVAVSLQRAGLGFLVASLLGVALGMIMGRMRVFSVLLEPILQMLRPIPAIAWVPFSILWFGVGESPKVFVIAIGVFFPVWLNTFLGARGMDRRYDEVSRVFGIRGPEAFVRVVFPATLPHIVAGLRTGLSLAFILLVAAELTGTSEGMGALISQSQLVFRTDRMVVGMVLLGLTGALVDLVFARVVKRFAYWEST